MKKKLVSMLMVAAMMATMVAGCGDSGDGNEGSAAPADNAGGDAAPEAPAATEAAPAADANADASADAAGGEAVTLKWAIWDQETTTYWQALADAYMVANPGVTIEMVWH